MRCVLANTSEWFWGSQTCGCIDFCMFSYCFKNLFKKSAEIACKKSFFTNKTVRLGVREKILELTIQVKNCVGRLLEVHRYPQKQTEWLYDA